MTFMKSLDLVRVQVAVFVFWMGVNDPTVLWARVRQPINPPIVNRFEIQKMIESLGDPQETVRMDAAKKFIRVDDSKVVPPLIKALGDSNVEIRRHVMGALAKYQEPEAVKGWRVALELSPYPDVRRHAAIQLQGSSDLLVVAALRKALKDLDANVRAEAVTGISQKVDETTIALIREAFKDREEIVRLRAWAYLRESKDLLLLPLLKELAASEDRRVCMQAVQVIGGMEGGPPVEALVQLIRTGSPEVRITALSQLNHFQDPRVIPVLREVLTQAGESSTGVQMAMSALAGIPHREAGRALGTLLLHPDSGLRWMGAWMLGTMGTAGGLSELAEALKTNPYPEIRQQAIVGLALSGETWTRSVIEGALQDEDDWVKFQAAGALRDQWEAVKDFPGEWKSRDKGAEGVYKLVKRLMNFRTVDESASALNDQDLSRQLGALLALGATDGSREGARTQATSLLQPFLIPGRNRNSEVPECLRRAAEQSLKIMETRYGTVRNTPPRGRRR